MSQIKEMRFDDFLNIKVNELKFQILKCLNHGKRRKGLVLIKWKAHTDAPRDLWGATLFFFPYSFILNNVMSAENKPILQALLEKLCYSYWNHLPTTEWMSERDFSCSPQATLW